MINLKSYEEWWTNNLDNKTYLHNGKETDSPSIKDFENWMGDPFDKDRIKARRLFGKFNTILDAGCGACPEYFGIKKMYKDINYTGLDITPKLVEYNKSRGIDCECGSLNEIPFRDNAFDIAHSRHVVEHMNDIEKPLSELIRVSKLRVYISFFIKPNSKKEHIKVLENKGTKGEIYHNNYSKFLINQLLKNNEKVINFRWLNLKPSELLLVNLKSNIKYTNNFVRIRNLLFNF